MVKEYTKKNVKPCQRNANNNVHQVGTTFKIFFSKLSSVTIIK